MKINTLLPLMAFLAMLLILNSCTKSPVKPVTPTPVTKVLSSVQGETDTTITLPVDSIKLTIKVDNSANTIAGYLWSQISGPNEAMITNESSVSPTFKGFITGKYLFQLLVIEKSGQTNVDTLGVIVNPSAVITINLSPANNLYETPLSLLGSQDASNHTSVEEPLAAWTIDGVAVTTRNLLKFDLSTIPANATIISADLYMYSDTIPLNGDKIHANYGNDNSFLVQQVAASWDPATVTWFNQPQGLATNQIVVPNTALPFLNLDINVINIVSSMVSTNANYGFKLSLVNEIEYTSRIFCSSYYSDATRHPRLIVKYKVQ